MRYERASESISALERVESELRSLPAFEDDPRVRELMRLNAGALNTARMRAATARAELDGTL